VIKQYFWILPFLSFLCGYQLLNYTTHVQEITVPSVVGLNLTDAIKIFSDHNINPRILTEKEEKDVAPGTILGQTPTPGHKIKIHQPIFLVVAKKAQSIICPTLLGKSETEVDKSLSHLHIRAKKYYLNSHYPQGNCIAQEPSSNSPLEDRKMTVYISAGNNKLLLFPHLKNSSIAEVKEFFEGYPITLKLTHTHPMPPEHQCNNSCIIVDQKPLPGTLIDLQKSLYVQLQLQ